MTADERLRHVRLKAERAAEHLENLRAEITSFLAASPCRVAARRDQQTRRLTYYVDAVSPVPDRVALIAGDAIQNRMSTLDHLAYLGQPSRWPGLA
jgi:hypothetical protein